MHLLNGPALKPLVRLARWARTPPAASVAAPRPSLCFPRSLDQPLGHIFAIETSTHQVRSLGDHRHQRRLARRIDKGHLAEIDLNPPSVACLPGLIPRRFEFCDPRLDHLTLHFQLLLCAAIENRDLQHLAPIVGYSGTPAAKPFAVFASTLRAAGEPRYGEGEDGAGLGVPKAKCRKVVTCRNVGMRQPAPVGPEPQEDLRQLAKARKTGKRTQD